MEGVIVEPLDPWQRTIKTLVDKATAGVLIAILSPLLFVIALAVKLQGVGPVLFQRARHSLNNYVFWILRFRSMHYTDINDTGAFQAQSEDPRGSAEDGPAMDATLRIDVAVSIGHEAPSSVATIPRRKQPLLLRVFRWLGISQTRRTPDAKNPKHPSEAPPPNLAPTSDSSLLGEVRWYDRTQTQ